MSSSDLRYFYFILIHIFIGFAIFYIPFFPKIYGYGIIFGGAYFVINAQNKNHEVLYAAAYIVGSEAVLRMTNGNPVYEFSKYGVMLFVLIGFYFKGISKNAIPYWVFLILLVPAMLITTQTLHHDNNMVNRLSFNLSGPLCLAICSLYCYQTKISFKEINTILLLTALPIISMTVYLTLYTPSLKEILTGTGSNFLTSGGFGPNQVSTVLGFGIFVFVSRLIYFSTSKVIFILNIILAFNIGYRGLVTFSRGGMLTGLLMIIVLVAITYWKVNSKGKMKMNFLLVGIIMAMVAIWSYSLYQTSGLIEKRYANQDARGVEKEDQFTGRGEIAVNEIETFLDYPIFGAGIARATEIRLDKTGVNVLSHSEITRMLAEHGSIGVLALLILCITPLVLYLDNQLNIYVLCFMVFWFMTINHAAMRMAFPAFIYSLSLLIVKFDEQ